MSASPIEDSPCRECGEELAPGARFCSSCGTPVGELPPVETVPGPVVHESVEQRWLGLPARFVLLCLGFAAFGVAIGLFATGSWAWGIVLLLLAIIGLASGGGGGGKKKPASTAGPPKGPATAHRSRPAAPPLAPEVKLKVVPTETTYVCVDDGHGTKLFEGTISTTQTFRGKRLRINMGRSSANVFLNGKPVSFARTAAAVGLSFSRTGRVTPIPPLHRPCV